MKNVLIMGRSLPDKDSTNSYGLFEFVQASNLKKYYDKNKKDNINIIYGFIDTRNVPANDNKTYIETINEKVPSYGFYEQIQGVLDEDDISYKRTKYFEKLINIIEKKHGKIDLIHVQFPLIVLTEQMIEYLNNKDICIIVTEHWSKVYLKELNSKEEKLFKKLMENTKKNLAVSTPLKNSMEEYINEFNILNKEGSVPIVEVVPNIVSNVTKVKDSNEDDDSRKKKRNGEIIFLTVGNLGFFKKNDLVLKAFKKFIDENEKEAQYKKQDIKNNIKYRIYLVGDGNQKEPLKQLTKQLELEDKVTFTGYLTKEKIDEMYAKSDIYLTGTAFETFGVPVIESYFAGKPVLIGDNHALIDFVNEQTGVLYSYDREDEEYTINQMYKGMKKISENVLNNRYDPYVINKYAKDNFSTSSVINKIVKIYNDVLYK